MNLRPTFLFPFLCALLPVSAVAQAQNSSLPVGPTGCLADPVVSSADDDGPGSLRSAVLGACDGATIRFSARFVITLASAIEITRAGDRRQRSRR